MGTTSSPSSTPNPLAVFSSFLHHQLCRLGSELAARIDDGRRLVRAAAPALTPFAAASQGAWGPPASTQGRHAFDLALSPEYVAKTLAGTAVYTVSNSNNEFVLVSDHNNGLRSLGLLCFRHEDAEALLAQNHQPPTSLGPLLPTSTNPQDFRGVATLMLGKRSMSFSGVEACEEMNAEDDLSDDCSHVGEKKKRLNLEQVRTLERNFEMGNKLEPERKMQLARPRCYILNGFAAYLEDEEAMEIFLCSPLIATRSPNPQPPR